MPNEAMIYAEADFNVGEDSFLDSSSPTNTFAVVFEDNQETAYFYALDTAKSENKILDALHIYNVSNVTDRHLSSKAQIVWSSDGKKSLLLINGYPHAAFDFSEKRGYCRTNFPPPDTKWTKHSHEWSDDVLSNFE